MADKDLSSIQEARDCVRRAKMAQIEFAKLDQGQVDLVVQALSLVMEEMSGDLAKLAADETGYGNANDKKQKNLLASKRLYERIRDQKTVGIVGEDRQRKIVKVAVPAGVIAALVPSTNPTSTTIYKMLIALKAGNAIVFSPHPSAVGCIGKTVAVGRQLLKELGYAEDLICMLRQPTLQGTRELMQQADLILATGGPDMVKAAYSSGTPALGVGPGNVPVFIEKSADIGSAVNLIMSSKTFDHGTVCSSEQAIITEAAIAEEVKRALVQQGGYFLENQAADRIKKLMQRPGGGMNPAIVGKTATVLAQMAGIEVPSGTRLLIYEEQGVGPGYPFSYEKLTALMGFYTVPSWQEASELSIRLLKNGGLGHSMAIHSKNEEVLRHFSLTQPVSRVLVNTPSTQGAVGLSTGLDPSMTLGCGHIGGSSTSDNVGVQHLFTLRYVAYGLEEPASDSQQDVDIETITKLVLTQLKKMNYVPNEA